MKAKHVGLAIKLRTFLGEIVELGKMDYRELSDLFDEVLMEDFSLKKDVLIHDTKVLMATLIHDGIMPKDEMQLLIDEVVNLYQAKERAGLISASAMIH